MKEGDVGNGIAADAAGNAYVTGTFYGLANFSGNVIGNPNGSQPSFFVLKVDPTGAYVWAKTFGSATVVPRIALDPSGNVVLCGYNAGPAALIFGSQGLVGSGLFAAKLDTSGGTIWAKLWSNVGGAADCRAVATGPSGEIVLTGRYTDTVDFGGGPLPTQAGGAFFVTKLTSAGAHVFSKGPGAESTSDGNVGNGIAVDGAGNVYVDGVFTSTIDLGSGPMTTAGGLAADVFVAKIGPTGTLAWLKAFGGMGNDEGDALALDGSGAPVIGGVYNGMIDFGNGKLPPLGLGSQGAFVAKLSP
jgi:hypothetical protein